MSNFAKQLERELAAVTEQRDRLAEELDALKQSMLDLSHPNMKLLLEERKEAREQRDRLMDALREIDMARLDDFMGPHDMALKCVLIARETLASVKGGQP
jgi:septal ring factor EnvC (AmiA/AmiB activator)